MAGAIIKAEGLTKKYKDLIAVKGLDLEVQRGEIFGLVGPDGAGKTTTIQMLCTILMPDSGRAEVRGLDIRKEAETIKEKIAYMSQIFSLFGNLTVEQNIDFFADLYHISPERREERKEKLFAFSRLGPFKDRIANQLSGGMKKKLALCCCLIHSPEILFLDEPTTGVDPVSRRDFWKILYDFLVEGVTIFVSTPYMDEAERFHRLALIYQGEVLLCDTPDNLRRHMPGVLLELRAVPQRTALETLKKLPFYQEVHVFGERLHILCEEFSEPLRNELEEQLVRSGCKVEDIRWITPGLEDTFISKIQAIEGGNGKKGWLIPDHTPTNKDNCGLGISDLGFKSDIQNSKSKIPKTPYAIEIKQLTKKFGNFTAVDNITLQVNKGEIFGFLGPNGAGKSTLIRMLCGLLLPTTGQGYIAGWDIVTQTRKIKPILGYMSQKFSLYKDLTVKENAALYAGLYKVPQSKLKERIEWVLAMAGLKGKEHVKTRELSGAWMQRLALGCAIVHEPEILFLDEPTAGVDPISRRHFWELIYDLSSRKGVTVFVTTHYMDEAEHCNRTGLIYGGKLIALGSPQELKTNSITDKLLELECQDPIRAFELLSNQPGLPRITFFGHKLHILTDNPQLSMTLAQDILSGHSLEIINMTLTALSLEDVFLALIEKEEANAV